MRSMCSNKVVNQCVFDGNIIKCTNDLTKQITEYTLEDDIPYIIKIYKKDNIVFINIISIIIVLIIIIFIYFLAYVLYKLCQYPIF